MARSVFAVELSLDVDGAVLRDGELTPPVRRTVDGVRDATLAALVRIGGPERLQTQTHFGVLELVLLYVGLRAKKTTKRILSDGSVSLKKTSKFMVVA